MIETGKWPPFEKSGAKTFIRLGRAGNAQKPAFFFA
jgi:hypothetical protein